MILYYSILQILVVIVLLLLLLLLVVVVVVTTLMYVREAGPAPDGRWPEVPHQVLRPADVPGGRR